MGPVIERSRNQTVSQSFVSQKKSLFTLCRFCSSRSDIEYPTRRIPTHVELMLTSEMCERLRTVKFILD